MIFMFWSKKCGGSIENVLKEGENVGRKKLVRRLL